MDTKMKEFEDLLAAHINSIERLVYYKIQNKEDAKDILQEVFLTAFLKFDILQDLSKFKPWIVRIATNKCNDYYRAVIPLVSIPLEEHMSYWITEGKMGITVEEIVQETVELLGDNEKQIITLYYLQDMSVNDIAERLHIPSGTVKSRLYKARSKFKTMYPYPPELERRIDMTAKTFPETLPEIKITKSNDPVFPVVYEELPSWFIIPKLGQKVRWAIYDYPARTRSEVEHCEAISKARIHGIDCVEIKSNDRTLYARITDTHVQYVAHSYERDNIKVMTTFLDEDFLRNWGYGVDNCGQEIHIRQNGNVKINDDGSMIILKPDFADVIGVYDVTIGNKTYQTLRTADMNMSDEGIYIERYIDQNGRTVLWRRYNNNNWKIIKNGHYKIPWSERLPENEKYTINNELFVHWYDCISDYVL